MKHDVFISYSRKDYVDEHKNIIPNNDVSKIKDALTKAGITYWFDEEGIYSGENFVEKIVTNIESAKIFLFLSTANANKSPWTCKEIASADEFKKHIIPVRIDSSPYNKKVLFRISDLDYIEYYNNPQKGIDDLIKSIKSYLDEFAAKERRKKEELQLQKELAEQRLQEEQRRLVSEIKLSCMTLNNEETKLELDREKLFLKAREIKDSSQRDAIICLIKAGGAIHQKYQTEHDLLTTENEKLKSTCSEIPKKEEQIFTLTQKLKESESYINELQETISSLNEPPHFPPGTNVKGGKNNEERRPFNWVRYYAIIISMASIALCIIALRPIMYPNAAIVEPDSTAFSSAITDSVCSNGEQNFIVNNVKFTMVPVHGGTFAMRTASKKTDSQPGKATQPVTLSSYYIGKTEVTQALWEAVMGTNPSYYKGDNRPVENVSWNDCQEFIGKLNSVTGKQFRLPTAAEWEYAASGGHKSKGYEYSGSDSILSVAWFCGSSNNKTQNVATKLPNELGIYDMSGNVWEWCQDSNGKFRAHRGGSWYNKAEDCRLPARYSSLPSRHYNFLGFRLALSKEQDKEPTHIGKKVSKHP